MNNHKYAVVILGGIVVMIGVTLGMFLIDKSTDKVASIDVSQPISTVSTTSESVAAAQTESFNLTVVIPVSWTQGQDFGKSVDLAKVLVSDLKPYTDMQLELSLSNWSEWALEGFIVFDRESGKLFFDPKKHDDVVMNRLLVSLHRMDIGKDIETVIKGIHNEEIKSYYEKNEPDSLRKAKESEENVNKYCRAVKYEDEQNQPYYKLQETDQYKIGHPEDQLDPCGMMQRYYVSEDFVIEHHGLRRQDGVALDKMIIK
jgi:hypothetical protein